VISGFGKVRRKIYVDDTCNLQVIDERGKEHNQRQGWQRISAKALALLQLDRKGYKR
jgi:hypothetical protein